MKINPLGSQGVNPYKRQANKYDQAKAFNQQNDKVEISSTAMKMQQVSQFSDQRQAKIDMIKSQIENGTYQINSKEVAKSIINFYSKN